MSDASTNPETESPSMPQMPVRRALISVSDKRGLVELATALDRLGVEILSTGGTERHLRDAGVPVVPVAEAVGFPEILDGRVKTLHPKIHGGILADRSRAAHLSELEEHGIAPIDLVVVNLYPFEDTVARPGTGRAEAVEMIDIGGPTMVRAAAKNHGAVTVVVDPEDYPAVVRALEDGKGEAGDCIVPQGLRRRLALTAFRHTAAYDRAIVEWLEGVDGAEADSGDGATAGSLDDLSPRVALALERELTPRYGENPHQRAAVYRTVGGPGILGGFDQLQGKELSWNNLLDADAARKAVGLFDDPAVVIVKHNNPCGIGTGKSLVEAYGRALATDPTSAFGSIIACNRPVSGDLAEAMAQLFVEVLVAPAFDDEARQRYGAKKNLRLLEAPLFRSAAGAVELRAIDGGLLAQDVDLSPDEPSAWTCPTRRQPTDSELRALAFAWKVCRITKSNAIVVTNEHQTVGVGAGQMSRVDSCRLALDKAAQAGLPVAGTAAASDAFFPFRDGLDVLAEGGVRAIIQPGGSKRDEEVIAAADEQGLTMLMTGRRHFRH